MGVAVLEGQKLIYHWVEVLSRPHSRKKILADGHTVILRMVRDFRPDVVAMEKVLFANNSRTSIITAFAADLIATVKRKRIPLIQLAASAVEKNICGNGHASKAEVARSVAARFPELSAYLRQDRICKNNFHSNRFDAVAVGLCAWERIAANSKGR